MKKIVTLLLLAAFLALLTAGCKQTDQKRQCTPDEIKVMLRLNVREDIGLLLYDVNDQEILGGISNADRSMLKRNEMDLVLDINRAQLGQVEEPVDLCLKFTVVTKYYEPTYEFDYPKQDMRPMEAISFPACFGEIYSITISGSRAEGYQAILEQPDPA